jgi:hypothetical protein
MNGRALAPPGVTRRGFLRGAGLLAAMTALARLRALPAGAALPNKAALPAGDRFFSDSQTEILAQLVERIADTGDPRAPAACCTRAVQTIDAAARNLDVAVSEQLPLALTLFEWGPLLFDLTPVRFTRMTPAQKDASLEKWMRSRLEVRRMAFQGVRNLAFLGFYSQPEIWPLIGYKGPLIGRGAPR